MLEMHFFDDDEVSYPETETNFIQTGTNAIEKEEEKSIAKDQKYTQKELDERYKYLHEQLFESTDNTTDSSQLTNSEITIDRTTDDIAEFPSDDSLHIELDTHGTEPNREQNSYTAVDQTQEHEVIVSQNSTDYDKIIIGKDLFEERLLDMQKNISRLHHKVDAYIYQKFAAHKTKDTLIVRNNK